MNGARNIKVEKKEWIFKLKLNLKDTEKIEVKQDINSN